MSKKYEFYDIFKKTCSYENNVGECTKTRETKKCVDNKCEKVTVPESKLQVLDDYYKQVVKQNGGAPGKYQCQFCNKSYSTSSGLRHHSLLHKNKIYKCSKKDCYYKTSNSDNFQKHLKKMHAENNQEYTLEPPYQKSINLEKLDKEWFEIQNLYKNQDGGDRTMSYKDKNGNIVKGKTIPIKRQSIMSNLLSNIKEKNRCPICHKYKLIEGMVKHLKKHEDFRCPICKEYLTRFTYSDHIDRHKRHDIGDFSPIPLERFPMIGSGKNKPKNLKLYNSIKKEASKKFKSPSGIYRSSWIVKEYIRRGGRYSNKKNTNGGLSRWFKEKWVDISKPIRNSKGKIVGYKSCGRKTQSSKNYPVCRPSKRVNSHTPRTYKEISHNSLNKAKRDKSKIKSSGNIKFGAGSCQNGGYYGSPKLKKILLSNLKKHECPVCKKIIRNNTQQHIKNHSLPRKISQIGSGQCGCGTLCFAPLIGVGKTTSKEIQCGGCGDFCTITGGGKIRSQYKGSRSKIMVNVPKNVKKVAEYSYKLKKIGFKGGIETGWKRAKQLSTKTEIPIEDLRYMRAWFARHIHASYPSYKKWQDAGRPKTKLWHDKHGIISWIIWGGNAAFKWVNSQKNINLLNKHYPDKNYKAMILK